jgi:sugar-phosphatase
MGPLAVALPTGRLSCQAILFDMDGVLVDSMRLIKRHLRDWALGNDLDPDHVVAASHGRTNEDLVRVVAPQLDAVAEAERMVAEDLRDVVGVTPCSGALALLEQLPTDTWAVVTSAYRDVAHARLHQSGIPVPRVLITADDVRSGKPEPEPYLAAADELGVPATDCLVVEDAPAGVVSARAAGAWVAGMCTSDDDELKADFAVTVLQQIRVLRC